MSIIPAGQLNSQPSLQEIPQSEERPETLHNFRPFFTQQIIEKITHSLIFPTLHFTYTSSRKLIMACKVICTVQNIVTHPVQSIAAGVFLYSDPYGARNLAIQGALAVIAVSAIDDYFQNLNGLAALKNFSSKMMKTSEALGTCQARPLPIVGYAEKTAILLSREIYYFSRDLHEVLMTPEQFRRDVEKICQIAREELINSLTLAPKEQFPIAMPISKAQSPLKAIETSKDVANDSLTIIPRADGSTHGENEVKKSSSSSHLGQLSTYASNSMEFLTSQFSAATSPTASEHDKKEATPTSNTQNPEQSPTDSATEAGVNSYWNIAFGGAKYVSSLAIHGLAKSKEFLSSQSTPRTQEPSPSSVEKAPNPSPITSTNDEQKLPPPAPTVESEVEQTLPINASLVNESSEASPPENHRLNYLSFLTGSFESVTYYAKAGVNAALTVSSSGLSSTLNGILKTKDFAIDGVSKTMASAYSLGEKIICSAGTKALTYASERMLKNVKSAAEKEIESAEMLLANNIIAKTAHTIFSTMISGGTQLVFPYFFFRQVIFMLPLPYNEEEQNRMAHTTALVVTVVGNLIWIKSILPSAKRLDCFYKMKFEKEGNKYLSECMKLVPDELLSLMQDQTINLKALNGITADYTYYAKNLGVTVEEFQKKFIERINRENMMSSIYAPLPSSIKTELNSYSTASTVTIEEVPDSTELILLGASPSKEK